MSALGQKQTFALQKVMSALPPIATQTVMSALPPKADMCGDNPCPLYTRKRTLIEGLGMFAKCQ
jgi:hypothetical protein